ncbi:uncharacterized protein EAE98_003678 [Botrytis deweyae]|uniref:Uncharacterized protein n=1 Tax=Botrytis deweyae TaxID=2478750 RepID=A0ABQ7IU95_9HELO|nr:uncharacterized protein EAE98_003678 [Botrytis deweyae]KAF7933969.1 hypothetical protein EAE98_003678 [Botrytis deweyae]
MDIRSSEEIYGGRLLREVDESEESLESEIEADKSHELLTTVTNTLDSRPSRTHIRSLDELWSHSYQNQPRLSVSGRQLPLLIHILTTLLSNDDGKVGKCVVLIDVHSRFSPSFLAFQDEEEKEDGDERLEAGQEERLKKSDLKHLHIFRPSAQNLESTLKGVEEYMLYGDHDSYGREFGGTILFGVEGREGVDMGSLRGMGRPEVVMGWRGWLRVEREEVGVFGMGG